MNKWKIPLITIASIVVIVLAIIGGLQASQNKAIVLEEEVNTVKSDVNIQEKRRIDLVYNLVDCVKEYDKHEAKTLRSVVRNRNSNASIENVSTSIAAVAEAYPELKSNENYKELMNELSITENQIAKARNNYNKSIKTYNRYVKKFPTRIFLGVTGYDVKDYDYLAFDAPTSAPQDLFEDK